MVIHKNPCLSSVASYTVPSPILTQGVNWHFHCLNTGCYLWEPVGQVKSIKQLCLEGFLCEACHANQRQRAGLEQGWCSHGSLLVKTVVGHRATAVGQRASCLGSAEDRIRSPMNTAPAGAPCYKSFTLKMFCLYVSQRRGYRVCGRQWPLPFGCTAWCFFCLQNPAGYYARYKWGRVGDELDKGRFSRQLRGLTYEGKEGMRWASSAWRNDNDRRQKGPLLATNLSPINLPHRFWNPAKLMGFKGKTPHPHILGGDWRVAAVPQGRE